MLLFVETACFFPAAMFGIRLFARSRRTGINTVDAPPSRFELFSPKPTSREEGIVMRKDEPTCLFARHPLTTSFSFTLAEYKHMYMCSLL
jgi:hypothetical protein